MTYLGDYATSTVIYGKFSTFRPSTGASYTLGGTPALSVYKDNSTTQSATGVTLTVDFDSVTGLHHFAIDTSADGTFYSSGSNFNIVITTGTVDGISVVGAVVGSFSLQKCSALRPTTSGRTLDVSATGEAGVDWANVGSPTTTVNLSGTTIATTQKVDVDTIKTNPVVNAGTVTFPTTATLASTTNITAGTITTASNVTTVNGLAANVITAAAVAADAVTEIQSGLATSSALSTVDTNVSAIKTKTDFLPSATAGTANGLFIAGSNAATTVNFTGSLSGSVGSVTGSIGSLGATAKSDVNAEVVDVLTVDTHTEVGQGIPPATATFKQMLQYLYKNWRNKKTETANTFSLYADDAITVDQKATVSDDGTTATKSEMDTGP